MLLQITTYFIVIRPKEKLSARARGKDRARVRAMTRDRDTLRARTIDRVRVRMRTRVSYSSCQHRVPSSKEHLEAQSI